MCGRFSLTTPEAVSAAYGVPDLDTPRRFNIAPSQAVLTIRDESGGRRHDFLRWGLIPSWNKDPKALGFINARCETLTEKPTFRDAFRRRRCVIPATGFFEWQKAGKTKIPYHIRHRDGFLLAFAGLWDRWISPAGETVESCSIITCTPNEVMKPVHDRMPAILSHENVERWLTLSSPLEELNACLGPFASETLTLPGSALLP